MRPWAVLTISLTVVAALTAALALAVFVTIHQPLAYETERRAACEKMIEASEVLDERSLQTCISFLEGGACEFTTWERPATRSPLFGRLAAELVSDADVEAALWDYCAWARVGWIKW